ncbi:MAG: DUF2203 domain-containing protein [Bryobacteraceae bacterium]|jgi:hypothetical protein
MSKRFTLAQAEALLPLVEKLLRDAVTVRAEFSEASQALDAVRQRVAFLGGVVVDREKFAANARRRDTAESRLRQAVSQFEEIGCHVKDLDIGLVDFPTVFRGVEVCLCWKLGEPRIGYWHGAEEGFRGRKPIDQDFLAHHSAAEDLS